MLGVLRQTSRPTLAHSIDVFYMKIVVVRQHRMWMNDFKVDMALESELVCLGLSALFCFVYQSES